MEPGEAMDRRSRICIWVISLGLVNFLAFTLIYMYVGGEAVNGRVEVQGNKIRYYIITPSQRPHQVSNGVFWYSGIHSISIWPTVGAILLAMLTLAKDRVIDSMHSTVVRGRTFLTILATIITLIVILCGLWGTLAFAGKLIHPTKVAPTTMQAASAPR
ncbi:MAG: hypothetical protein NTV86_07680 [Planctomycetota bacterium]|nr:hypothetical protein [Planctomycetota bacterium]